MAVSIYAAPASSGKTAYVLGLAREAAQGLRSTPRVVVPTALQVRACRRRLAHMGGAIAFFTWGRSSTTLTTPSPARSTRISSMGPLESNGNYR